MSPISKLSSPSGRNVKFGDDDDNANDRDYPHSPTTTNERRNLFGAPFQSNGKINENGFLTKPSTTQTINRSPTKQHRRLAASLNGISGQSIRARLAVLREQVRVEDIALASATSDDHKLSKDCVGGWALAPAQMTYLRDKQYEYNASAGSILELFCLQRFWIYLAQFIPKRVAPCTITAIGFFINLFTCSIMIVKSPDARSDQVSSWALLLCALGVFLYQIADALDGKQCYKVQNTQIEEYYDHGCDAVSTILLMYAVGIATQTGQYPVLFLMVIFSALFAFYTTHWLGYVTSQMVFGKIDVTEGQWSMIIIHTASALFGQQIWQINLVNFGGYQLTLGQLLALTSLATFLTAIVNNVSMILFGVRTPLEKCGVSIKRKQGLYNCVKPVLPAIFLCMLLMKVYTLGYYHLNTTFFILTFGFTFAKLTMKLVIAHCTNWEMELRDPALVAPILLVLNHYLVLIEPHKALLCALICNGIELIRYFTSVSWDLRVALDVDIFAIRYPPEHPKSRRHCGGFYVNGLNNQEVLHSQLDNKKDIGVSVTSN